jgi:hypothetical protein
MNSPFKFLRRVRIHGGECGAVARALHHEVKGSSLYQADSGKALGSTFIERKQMSTKTTLKRIALVVVSALGLGVLATMAPANATLRQPTAISFDGTTGLRAGETKAITVSFSLPTGTVNGDTIAVVARVTSAPTTSFAIGRPAVSGAGVANSTAASGDTFHWSQPASGNGFHGTLTVDSHNIVGATSTDNWTAATEYTINSTNGDSLTTGRLTLNIKPDAAGSYVILVGVASASTLSYDTQTELRDATTANLVANLVTASTTVTTGSTPDKVTLTQVTSGAPQDTDIGALWKATATTAGAATNLSSSETFVLSSNSSTVTFANHAGVDLTNNTLTSSMFSAGVAYFTVQSTAEETASITITGSGLLSSSVTGTGTVTFTTSDEGAASAFSIASTTTSLAVNSVATPTEGTYYGRPGASSYPFRVTGTAENVETVTVTDTYGKITGKAGAKFDKTLTLGATATPYASFTVTPLAAFVAGESFIVELLDSAAGVRKVTVTMTASTPTSMTVSNDIRRVAAAASTSFTATLKDQYGSVMANEVVNVSVSGRNATTSSAAYTTNSLGQVTHTVTDAGTASVNDTVTFTSSTGSKSDTGTIIYGTATAGAVELEGPNTDDTLITYADKIDIAAGATGAQATTAPVEATVEDASGNPLNGMLVTFTVAGTNCAITSSTQSQYTGADGTATAQVYKWTNGSCDVTATSGGVTSAADTVHFAQKTATEARTLAGTVAGSVITATVKDRFGNPINGAYVHASRTGGGFFANGASSTSAATGEDGTVQFVYSTDTTTAGEVKLQLGSQSAADPEYGQSAAGANLVTSPSLATNIFTATTVGTAILNETGVGASLAPAGVNSVTVTVAAATSATQAAAEAATDAAAEAIDAANAATDAANLAAEAADAATVAAEEARDAADAATAAVEELATQVATLMAALKAQITTLANTVAKIAKKVKA